MDYLIKYGFYVAFLVSIFMNIVEPSLEHKILQAVMTIGLLLFLYIDWHIERIYKKGLQNINQNLRLEYEAKITDKGFEKLYKKIDEKIFKSYLKFGWILLLILIAISVFNIFVYMNS